MVATPPGVLDGPRVQLQVPAPEHLWPEIAIELLSRVADSMTGHPWHVATSLLGDDNLLVVGLSKHQLQIGLAAERATWRAAAKYALERFNPAGSDSANDTAIHEFSETFLRAVQADLLLTAVQALPARDNCRDEARLDAPGRGSLPPDTPGASDHLGASRHDCRPDAREAGGMG